MKTQGFFDNSATAASHNFPIQYQISNQIDHRKLSCTTAEQGEKRNLLIGVVVDDVSLEL
jgi:hypothetical protein